MFKPVLSVVTIVYNNAADIERTMLSVLNQQYPHIEYIVIDGRSTDGTVALVEKYRTRLAHFVSEPDKGIYDAMNKGLAAATGDYVLFMNSGDEIYDPGTVARIFATAPEGDIYYGETEMYNGQWQSLGRRRHAAPKRFTWRSFRYGMSISHQAFYARRSLCPAYDTTYRYSADIDWVIRIARRAGKIVRVDGYVAKYLVGGISKKAHKASLNERFKIFTRHYGLVGNVINHGVMAARLALYYVMHGRTND